MTASGVPSAPTNNSTVVETDLKTTPKTITKQNVSPRSSPFRATETRVVKTRFDYDVHNTSSSATGSQTATKDKAVNQAKKTRSAQSKEKSSSASNPKKNTPSMSQLSHQNQIINKIKSKLQARSAGKFAENESDTENSNQQNQARVLLQCLLRGKRSERDEMLSKLRSGQIVLTVEQLIDVIFALNRSRKISTALKMLDMVESGPLASSLANIKSVKSYTIMIDTYGKGYQLSKAFSVFYGMSRNGVRPNAVTYNALIAACSRNDEPSLAFEVFEEMKQSGFSADKYTFGALIDSFAKCGQADRAFELADTMESNGIPKDQTIYSSLLDSCARTGQSERTLMLFEEMKRKGVWPNLVTFSVLIDTCAKTQHLERAFQIFSEMKHWGIGPPNLAIFTSMIGACSKCGWPDHGELVLNAMINHGLEPNQIIFGGLMEGWAKQGRLDRAFALLDRMVNQHNLHPNAVLIGGLTNSVRKLRETALVDRIWQVIVKYNLRPSRIYYPCLIVMAVMDGNVRLATAIVLHAYARGCFRRASLHSEDPSLHAIACAIVFYRHEVVKKAQQDIGDDSQQAYSVAAKNVNTVFKSIAMSQDEMDSMPAAEARDLCLTWGDFETVESHRNVRRHSNRRDRRGSHRKDSRPSAASRKAKTSPSTELNITAALQMQ